MTVASIWEGYPRKMVHPGYRVDPSSQEAYRASQTRLAPVTVFAPHQEDEYRGQGYRLEGEMPPDRPEQVEYPKTMCHPEYQEGVPATTKVISIDNVLTVLPVPGVAEKFPHVIAEDAAAEKKWRTKGYSPAGEWSFDDYDDARHLPGNPGSEYPKWVDGELVADPSLPPAATGEYPKCVFPPGCDMSNPPIAKDREDETRLMGMAVAKPSTNPDIGPARPVRVSEASVLSIEFSGDTPAPSGKPDRRKRTRAALSEEQRKEIGRRFAEGRQRAKERREASGEVQSAKSDARVQDGIAAQRIEEGTEGQEPQAGGGDRAI